MLCENCGKNPATTYIKRVINGVKTEKHLCSKCAAALGYSVNTGNNLANILASMFGDMAYSGVGSEKTCKCCGCSFNDIVKNGKVGCPECYITFIDELAPYLKRIHGNVKHIGKIPNRSSLAVADPGSKVMTLRHELNTLIKNEEFEKAAKVRDEIRELERKGEENE